MAITTYGELQAAAANWLVRADLTTRIPEFIALAEARLNRTLRARLAEVEVSLSSTPGARFVLLPAGFTEPLALWIVLGGARKAMRAAQPSILPVVPTPGQPSRWSVDGATLAFDRPCDQVYGLVLRMLAKFSLSNAAPTNALLSDYPDAYLYATLAEAGPFLRDAELADTFEGRLQRVISEINAKDARTRPAPTLISDAPPQKGAGFDISQGY